MEYVHNQSTQGNVAPGFIPFEMSQYHLETTCFSRTSLFLNKDANQEYEYQCSSSHILITSNSSNLNYLTHQITEGLLSVTSMQNNF